jgi:multiple sugar transport system permease protein
MVEDIPTSAQRNRRNQLFGLKDSVVLNERLEHLFLLPSLVFLLLVVVVPALFAGYISVTKYNLTGAKGIYIGLTNFQQMVHSPAFLTSFGRTIFFTSLAVFLELLFGFLVAMGLHKISRYKSFLLNFVVLPMVITPAVIGYLFRFMMEPSYGIINYVVKLLGFEAIAFTGSSTWSLFSVVIADVWQWTPFMALSILAGLQAIPDEPFEAARMDGANAWQRFKWVTVPLLMPIISVSLLIRGMDAFRIFTKVYIMTQGGPGTSSEVLSMYVYQEAFSFGNLGYGTSVALFMLYIILIGSWIYLKYTKRVEAGGGV